MIVTPKKALGQHFLRDLKIADRIVESLSPINADFIIYNTGSLEGLHLPKCNVLEVGPGMGVLTQYLVKKDNINFKAVEIDSEAVEYLQNNIPDVHAKGYRDGVEHCIKHLKDNTTNSCLAVCPPHANS